MTPQEGFQSWLLPYAAIGLGLVALAIGAILVGQQIIQDRGGAATITISRNFESEILCWIK